MRALALAVFALTALTVGNPATGYAAGDAPVQFMQRVAKELLRAHHKNSEAQMTRVIRSRADVGPIGRFSLGTYYARLHQAKRPSYFNGMTKFMSRYLISQSRTYRVAKAEVLRPSSRRGRDYIVNSRVTLTNGSVYDVQWLLAKRGSTFKVRDVQVMGFWVLPFQRNLFRSYVRKADGDVNKLVLALNQ